MQLLFVDDEQRVLDGIRRELLASERGWEAKYALSGEEALCILAQEPCDALITDMRMPGMDGVALLREVAESYPHIFRVALSGHCEKEAVMRSITLAHRYMGKPSTAQDLERIIDSAFSLRTAINNPAVASLVNGLGELPTLPRVFLAVDRELSCRTPSIQRIGDLIAEDISLTAKLLQLVNSAFFAFVRTITSVSEAVTYLGLDTIRGLVAILEFPSCANALKRSGLSHERLMHHSTSTARLARHICRTMNLDAITSGQAFVAAMLHDIGQLILAGHFPDEYLTCDRIASCRGCPVWRVQDEVFGTSHGFVGAYLLSLWGLSDPVVTAVAYHHHPLDTSSKDSIPLVVTHLADQLVDGLEVAQVREYCDVAQPGMSAHLEQWKEVARGYETKRSLQSV